jgi:hypothetical protein
MDQKEEFIQRTNRKAGAPPSNLGAANSNSKDDSSESPIVKVKKPETFQVHLVTQSNEEIGRIQIRIRMRTVQLQKLRIRNTGFRIE